MPQDPLDQIAEALARELHEHLRPKFIEQGPRVTIGSHLDWMEIPSLYRKQWIEVCKEAVQQLIRDGYL